MLGRPEDPQVLPPRPNSGGVLPAHYARDLDDVIQVMRHPRGQELGKCHLAKCWMPPSTPKIGLLKVESGESPKTVGSQVAEDIQELG